jgi:hypothetical protein
MDDPILKTFISSYSSSKANPSIGTIVWAWIIRFNYSKFVIKKG